MINFGLIKSRFYYVRGQNLTVPWFLDFWTPGAPYFGLAYTKNTTTYKKTHGNIFGNPYLCKYGNLFVWSKVSKVWMRASADSVHLGFWNCWTLVYSAFCKFRMNVWNFANSRFWNVISNLGNDIVGTWPLGNYKFGNMLIWNLEIWSFFNLKI